MAALLSFFPHIPKPCLDYQPKYRRRYLFDYSGELNVVSYGTTSTYILTPTSTPIAKVQPYNKTNFAEVPKVILSLIGFTHTPPSLPSTTFGLQITITSIAQLKFYYNISTYGCSVVDWHYLYLAVQYEASTFYMDRISQSCK